MCTVHRLEILHRVPVVLHEDDRVRAGEREAEPADMRREQEAVDARVRVERLHDRVSLVRVRRAVETHVRHRRHVLLEQVRLDDVQHLLHLAEDQHPVLRERARARLLRVDELRFARVARGTRRKADAAVEQQLTASDELIQNR